MKISKQLPGFTLNLQEILEILKCSLVLKIYGRFEWFLVDELSELYQFY